MYYKFLSLCLGALKDNIVLFKHAVSSLLFLSTQKNQRQKHKLTILALSFIMAFTSQAEDAIEEYYQIKTHIYYSKDLISIEPIIKNKVTDTLRIQIDGQKKYMVNPNTFKFQKAEVSRFSDSVIELTCYFSSTLRDGRFENQAITTRITIKDLLIAKN